MQGRLEHLRRFNTRPPIATKRLSIDNQSLVVYQDKMPFPDESTHAVLLGPPPAYQLNQFHPWPRVMIAGATD